MRGFQPVGDKKAPAKKSAGPVRGPGTGTSDEVQQQVQEGTYIMPTDSTEAIGEQALAAMGKGDPVNVNLSNGEFKVPPEQVHAIGVQALDQMKAATHTPVATRGLPAPAKAPSEPPMFFVNGGEVDKDKPSYPSPTNIFPGNRLPGPSGSTSAPPEPAAAPAPTATAPAVPAAPAKRSDELTAQLQGLPVPQFQRDVVQRQALEGQIQRVQANERYDSAGAQMAAEAREAATMRMNRAANRPLAAAALPASTGAAALAAHDAGGAGAGRGFVNPPLVSPAASAPAAAAPPAAPVPPPAPAPAAAAAAPSASRPAAHEYGPPASAAPPAAPEVLPGIFRVGNSYGDSQQAAITGAAPRGLPTPDTMAAADVLAQRSQQASAGRVATAPVERGWSGVIGTDPAAGRERRELVSALTTPVAGARGLTAAQRNGMLSLLDQEARGAQAKANNATALQQTEMQTGTQRDLAAMREAGDNGRAVLREAGETNRAGARNTIDQGRLGLEQQVRGFDIRAGQRQERLHQRYEAAKTPEERSAIAQQIRDLAGKTEQANRFTVVSGGQEWDSAAGAMRNVPARVLNNHTGQFVDQVRAPAGQPAGLPKIGEARNGFRYKGGNPNIEANWEKV